MSEHGGLYDSTTWSETEGFYKGNKALTSAEIAAIFDSQFTSGIVYNADYFTLTVTSGLTVSLTPGYAWIRGRAYYEDATTTKTFDTMTTDRTVYLVLRQTLSNYETVRTWVTNPGTGVLPVRETDIHDLVLYKIKIPANATEITAANLTDYRANSTYCGYSQAKAVISQAISAITDAAMSGESENPVQNKVIKAYVDANTQTYLTFTDTNVLTSAFTSYSASGAEETALHGAGYTYRAAIPLTGVTANMMAEVVFSITQANDAKYATTCKTYAGGVYIYAKAAPAAAITIPTIRAIGA